MLHLIPPRLHRLLYRAAYGVRRQWRRVGGARRSGVNVVVFNDDGQVLLVRHSYGPPNWSLPGGGINRGEDPEAAAIREIREELGCGLAGLTAIDASEERTAGSRDFQHVFSARLEGTPVPDMREIVAVTFADPEDLPEHCGQRARQRIAQVLALGKAPRSQQR